MGQLFGRVWKNTNMGRAQWPHPFYRQNWKISIITWISQSIDTSLQSSHIHTNFQPNWPKKLLSYVLWTKTYAHIWACAPYLGHNAYNWVKCQYFWMKPALFDWKIKSYFQLRLANWRIIFMWTQKTIIFRLVVTNPSYNAYFSGLIFWAVLRTVAGK